MKSVIAQILARSEHTPDKTALIGGNRALTYAGLVTAIQNTATCLGHTHGVQAGDKVVLAAVRQPEFITAYFACHLLGAVAIPLAAETEAARFAKISELLQPRVIVGFDRKDLPGHILSWDDLCAATPNTALSAVRPEPSRQLPALDQAADLMFTSGTTGSPKAVMLTQRNLAASCRNINEFVRNNPDDVELLVLPLAHSFGLGRMRCALTKGQTLILGASLANVKNFYSTLSEYRVNGLGLVPAALHMLQRLSGDKLAEYRDHLHYLELGSAELELSARQQLMHLLPHTRLCMHYGLTEASRSTFIEFHAESDRLDTAGRPAPHVKVVILDEHGQTLPDGTAGEICIAGEHVARIGLAGGSKNCLDADGLAHSPGATPGGISDPDTQAASDSAAYLHSGDWGVRSPDGYITLIGRKKELISVGGKKVSPAEIETVLRTLPQISDCACVGVPDPQGILGEVVKAFIVPTSTPFAEPFDVEAMDKLIGTRLESYKHPAFYEVVSAIPRTASGKIKRGALTSSSSSDPEP